MTEVDKAATFPPNWMFEIGYWIADGDPEPDVPWPDDWDVCSVPTFDPFAIASTDKRLGHTWMARPMYAVDDPMPSLAEVFALLERMTPEASAIWLSLQDRYLSMSCSDKEMDAAGMDAHGFSIPPDLIQRLRGLRLRLNVSFHPEAEIRWNIWY